jgi:hypothetical protein
MKYRSLRALLRGLPLTLALTIAGCGAGSDSSSKNAQIRMLNVSSGYESLDLYSNDGDDTADTQQLSSVTQGSISSYVSLKGDTYSLKFRKTGTTGDLLSSSATLASDTHTTYVAHGAVNQFAVLAIDDDVEAPASNYTKVTVLNATGADGLDIYLTGSSDSLDDVSATVSGLAAGAQSSATTLSSGSYRLRVTGSGSKSDLRLNVPEISLPSAGVVSIILTRSSGGVLVNAILLPKQGQPTTYDNTATASIRVLNASAGYDSLELYTSSEGSDTDTRLFTAIARGTATDYAAVKADTYTLKFRRTGSAGNLLATSATLAEERHTTLVAYGASGRFGVFAVDEEVEAASTSYAKLQVLNGTAADNLDVYLTGTDDALNDVAAAISAVPAGSTSGFTSVRSGSYRLRITSAGSKTDLRLDVPAITLASTGVASLVVTEAPGGVLVSAILLPQQGAPTRYDNSSVRIRGSAGLTSGSMVTISVGATEIVTRRSARSYIAESYTMLAAGIVPFAVYVDNVAVASGTATLEAGKDYTLLAWSGSGSSTQIALVTDDNHASATHRARLRLLNAMSGVAVPLTLSVNYSPTAEYIDAGTASEGSEISAGTDYRLDVIDAQTLATLLTRETVTLAADGVYTLFVAGGGSSAVTATLRKDR